jgi:hypothetical protein
MNVYGEWWNNTITLYNKFTDPTTHKVSWFRTVIPDCYYEHTQNKLTVGQAVIASDVSICRIRVNDAFLNKRAWNELSAEDKAQHFTLSIGDIIVAGEVEFDVDEYAKDHRSSDLVKEFREWPGCFTVESVNINVGGGRGNEHYHARGV